MMRGLLRGAAIAALVGFLLGVGSAFAIDNMRSSWDDQGNLYWWDARTSRLIYKGPWIAPVSFFDDFLGAVPLSAADSKNGWSVVDVAGASESTVRSPNGIARLSLSATSQAEDAVLYWADQCAVDVGQNAIIEFYAGFNRLPTSTGTSIVMGMGGLHNLDKDTMTESAWFRLQGSGALLAETDDTTNNNDDISCATTLVAGTNYLFKIDFTTLTDVKFYVNDVQVATGTTFDMSNLTATEAVMQPYFSLDKANNVSGNATDSPTLDLDWVRITSTRQ